MVQHYLLLARRQQEEEEEEEEAGSDHHLVSLGCLLPPLSLHPVSPRLHFHLPHQQKKKRITPLSVLLNGNDALLLFFTVLAFTLADFV